MYILSLGIKKKDIVAFTDFEKLDFRVGEVKETVMVEGSKKLMGKDSNGMTLVADDPEKLFLLPLDKNLKNGTVIR